MKKHILCFGDSNTHGHCAEPWDCADGGRRFNEEERWPCLLKNELGDGYLVIEEGLPGRTTVFRDPLEEGRAGIDAIYPCMRSHMPVDLLIIMLGTNDTKERYAANPACIGAGMERLVQKAKAVPAWRDGRPNILIVAPPHIGPGMESCPDAADMGKGCVEKSRSCAEQFARVAKEQGCAFMDGEGVAEFNPTDCMHLSRRGHRELADALAELIPALVQR
ncbi:MAG: SGNH/GDSL hydrolase family protein [Clostridia bacterium]|nr:SGNH/GDSL hydrolase family protein [Clostridia bacterium]MBQ4611387.1 SGNH/GDSL hydrolase family protein [Clostridia bacterium]MBQ6703733.1 SGNH/GDSL hydrolase family protein [Clostridia bacterium]